MFDVFPVCSLLPNTFIDVVDYLFNALVFCEHYNETNKNGCSLFINA